MPRKLAEAAVRMRRASARLDVPPPSARRLAASNPLTSLLPDVILGALQPLPACQYSCRGFCGALPCLARQGRHAPAEISFPSCDSNEDTNDACCRARAKSSLAPGGWLTSESNCQMLCLSAADSRRLPGPRTCLTRLWVVSP